MQKQKISKLVNRILVTSQIFLVFAIVVFLYALIKGSKLEGGDLMTLDGRSIAVIVLVMALFIVPLWILFGRLACKFSKLAKEMEEMNKKKGERVK